MPLLPDIRKVLVIGSGPIVIGQAAEFDYAGAQACRVLKKAGLNVVLINPNPATIMTDRALADEIYLEPLTEESVCRVIEKERPDGLLAGLGGQTALTIAMRLHRSGFLKEKGVQLLGMNAGAIEKAEDRKLFKETMEKIGQPTIPSGIAKDVETAAAIARRIGYPVIIRPAYTLGGAGGGTAENEEGLRAVAANGLRLSPITQVLVEKYIYGWKEIEFETMRDSIGNVIAICSMENFDPVGVHTGDSIVAAPALTLSDKEYQMLRGAALSIIEALGIVGGCNCQFALNPESFEYAVIEVNPRVSRSSALASKATGYPIAKVAAQVALGYTLDEIANEITGRTCACFEPALDYVVVKLPRFPFDKFVGADRALGTQMKATGEVMAIAPSFEMALMKAVRGAEIALDTLNRPDESGLSLRERLKRVDDHRLFTIFEALKSGVSIAEIHAATKVDEWFLGKLQNLAAYEGRITGKALSPAEYREGKRLGYTDTALRRLSGQPLPEENAFIYKMVDTCGAEFDAQTPYFYAAAGTACEARSFPRSGKPVAVVLGSGPIRIGQGIEFDYSSVHCAWTLKEQGYDVVIINNNPETVSTDYDTADRLYFEPLYPEDVWNILQVEKPAGVVVAFGGQTAIKLTKFLHDRGIPILGTSAEGIDIAEDRERFDALLRRLEIKRPQGRSVKTMEEALAASRALGYPVLLRPSYVIGGQNMAIAHGEEDVRRYMLRILSGGIENPVLIDQYMRGVELEVDVISDGEQVLIPGIMEHIERAGVHSGDSIAVYPPYNLSDTMMGAVEECSKKLALALGTKGLVNIQYLIWQNELFVIEVNPRASRTVPYISKVTGVPMVELAAKVMIGHKLRGLGFGEGLYPAPPYCAVKVPVFSFEKLSHVNAYLGPEMKSTGEVLGLGKDLGEALFKGLAAAGIQLAAPTPGRSVGALLSVDAQDAFEVVGLAKRLFDLGFSLYATPDTAETIRSLGIDAEVIPGIKESENAFRLLESGKISLIVYTGALQDDTLDDYIALHRRALQLSIPCFTSLDTANALTASIASRYTLGNTELVDINHLRAERQILSFCKMQDLGNDYLVAEDFGGVLSCPESLAVRLCDRHRGVGADGLALLEKSQCADVKMRMFNQDGTEGRMAGNCLRYAAKYLYDNGLCRKKEISVETASGIRKAFLNLRNGKVSSVRVEMGRASLNPADLPALLPGERAVDVPFLIDGEEYRATCVSVGNPHCVVFCSRVDGIDLQRVGPQFEHSPLFPQRVNVEFVRVVNPVTLKMRVWERGNGETQACGTGACAAVAAAVEKGYCPKDQDITVKLRGGDLLVRYTAQGMLLTGNAETVFSGTAEY